MMMMIVLVQFITDYWITDNAISKLTLHSYSMTASSLWWSWKYLLL